MDEKYDYLKIAASIRRDIANGMYKPGDTLPSIRDLTVTWQCTIGTTQRAIQKLVSEGLVTTHVGKGTKVAGSIPFHPNDSLRRANLIHQAEAFLLGVLTSGYAPIEVEDAFRIALNRWRSVSQSQGVKDQRVLLFSGSHDPAVAWLATHFDEISPGFKMHLSFSGSMAGLISMVEGKSDIAGSHLWDDESESYNIPFLYRRFPGERLALITLAQRRIGLIVKPGNPENILSVDDLTRQNIRLVNRQEGSGTRVYLDSLLRKKGIQSLTIRGYLNQKTTHTEIAAEVAEGNADVGLGLEAAAKAYDLDFLFLTLERYDLVVKANILDGVPIQNIISWLKSDQFRLLLNRLGGYDYHKSGEVLWT